MTVIPLNNFINYLHAVSEIATDQQIFSMTTHAKNVIAISIEYRPDKYLSHILVMFDMPSIRQ